VELGAGVRLALPRGWKLTPAMSREHRQPRDRARRQGQCRHDDRRRPLHDGDVRLLTRMSANEVAKLICRRLYYSNPSAADANAGTPEAACAIGRPHNSRATIAVAVATMNADCATRTDASRPVWTGRACSGVGFRHLKPE